MTTTITNKQETTFIKTDKNREQILKEYNHTCFDCKKKEVKKDDLDVYILDINIKPHKILPICISCYEQIMRQQENYDRQVKNMIVSKKNEKEYKEAKHRFRTNLRHAYDDMNTMIRIVIEDNPGWSIKRIIKQILLENEDIGVSERSVYNHLDDQNRALVDPKYHHKPHQENIIIDNNGANLRPQVIEDSSIYQEIDNAKSQIKELTDEEKEEKAKKLLPEPIYNYAKEREISPDKMLMIAHTRLAKHPPLQESLINDVVTKSKNDAKNTVDQMIHDIETGALSKEGNSYRYNESVREKLEVRPTKHYLNLLRNMHKMLFALTGHKINKGEYRYFEETVTYSKDHRRQMLDELNDLAIVALDRDMRIVKLAVDNMLELIQTKVLSSEEEQQT